MRAAGFFEDFAFVNVHATFEGISRVVFFARASVATDCVFAHSVFAARVLLTFVNIYENFINIARILYGYTKGCNLQKID